jgi:EpsI family protein
MTPAVTSWLRFSALALLLAGTAALLEARNQAEVLPPHSDLPNFPLHVGDWAGVDAPLSPGILRALGPGEFLSRVYQRNATEPYVSLFIAFFPSQRQGDTIHSPRNCLPGSGWTPIEAGRIPLSVAGPRTVEVNRYVIAKGMDRDMVLYWYQAHGRVTASEYWAKIFLVTDAVRENRSDGSMIRVITPILDGENELSAQDRALQFTSQLVPTLSSYIPQ